MVILSRQFSLSVAVAAIIGLGACGTVQAQGNEDFPGKSGMLCQEPSAFAYVKKWDGSLDFAYRMYLRDATCAFNGLARPNSAGWTFHDKDDCTFTIKLEGNAVSFTAEDDSCRDYCGFKAHVTERSISTSAVADIEGGVTSRFLEDEFYRFECP